MQYVLCCVREELDSSIDWPPLYGPARTNPNPSDLSSLDEMIAFRSIRIETRMKHPAQVAYHQQILREKH